MNKQISETYNMDCMAYMQTIPDKYFELAIVDPPYQNNDAIGLKNSNGHSAKRKDYHVFENIAPSEKYFTELYRVSKKHIIWGGNFFGLKGGVIAWNKNGTAFGEGEMAICNTHSSVRFFEYTWNGMIQGNMQNKETRIHPTQKPIALYKWLLQNYANKGDKILDTHMGSGSSRIAAWDMGFDYYSCELDKEYYEAAEKRFQNHIKQTKLFTPDELKTQPLNMFSNEL